MLINYDICTTLMYELTIREMREIDGNSLYYLQNFTKHLKLF